MASSSSTVTIPTGTAATSKGDAAFLVDSGKLAKIASEKPWLKNVQHFKKVKVSAVAAMKMTTHASSGVEKGLKSQNHLPIEVMGLMQGHIDTSEEGCLIVTDVFPLPVEGTETSVLTDNPEVMNYMISLSDTLEATRAESFMGWYHSHPFDVGAHSNCFLSATDVSTQLSWQLSEDRAGNPWLALVVDPLRGVAKGKPEVGAFRCYPPSHTPPKGTAPDGSIWADERARNARWGESCVSYYQLEVEYFMSSASAGLMGMIARDFMWTRVLSSTPMLEGEARDRIPDRLHRIAEKVEAADMASAKSSSYGGDDYGYGGGGGVGRGGAGGMSFVGFGAPAGGRGSDASSSSSSKTADIAEAATSASELASEVLRGQGNILLKAAVFENIGLGSTDASKLARVATKMDVALSSSNNNNNSSSSSGGGGGGGGTSSGSGGTMPVGGH